MLNLDREKYKPITDEEASQYVDGLNNSSTAYMLACVLQEEVLPWTWKYAEDFKSWFNNRCPQGENTHSFGLSGDCSEGGIIDLRVLISEDNPYQRVMTDLLLFPAEFPDHLTGISSREGIHESVLDIRFPLLGKIRFNMNEFMTEKSLRIQNFDRWVLMRVIPKIVEHYGKSTFQAETAY